MEMHLRNLDASSARWAIHIDVILFGDDLGHAVRPAGLAARCIASFSSPASAPCGNVVKQRAPHLKIMLHCCGGVRELLPGLIDAGLDAINPVQITCRGMDAAGLKRDFGSQLTFWGGGCDTRDVLIQGTPAQVREHVRQQVEHLAARRRLRLPAGPQHHGRRAARQHRGDVRRGVGLNRSERLRFTA